MPIPKPNTGERKEAYISRCMANPTMNREYKDRGQRFAVCGEAYERAKRGNSNR